MQEFRAPSGGKAESFVFASERGTPLRPGNIWGRSVQPKLAMKGLGWVNFRIMRRTFITLGKVSGADPKAMADQAGRDIGVSASVYTQTPVETKIEVVRALEKLILWIGYYCGRKRRSGVSWSGVRESNPCKSAWKADARPLGQPRICS
jgi:hypothetical protein